MPKRKQMELRQANLSYEEMETSITRINRRLKDIEDFDIDSIDKRNDPKIMALSNKLDSLLISIFGTDTVEYKRYHWQVITLDTAGKNIAHRTPIEEVRNGLKQGLANAKEQLLAIKSEFEENLEDAGKSSTGKTLKAYEGLELHPAIERASGQLFRDGHYANAIEDAVKALNSLVRLNSGVDDKDGTVLMEYVFNPTNPILKFNDLSDKSDKEEQKGFMMMFSGSVSGLRNPRAHKIIKDDPKMTIEFIAFISLLATLADKAKK